MSAGCVKWLLTHSARVMASGSPACWSPLSRGTMCKDQFKIFTLSWRRSTFCTEVDNTLQQTKKKKQSGHNNATVSSVGRKIPQRLIQVIGETGDNMGTMHRSEVIKIMDEQGLKLVLLNENQDPPVYRLMSGKQIHEEQLRLREKQKSKPVPVQVKELTFSSCIASHDLSTKLKQVESWLEKKHHVRITLRSGRDSAGSLDSTLEGLVQQMEVDFEFVSKPKLIRDGQAAMCIMRPPSAKELVQKSKKKTTSDSDSLPLNTSVANDTTGTTTQQ